MVYSLRGSVQRISIHSITITSQSCNSCPSSLSSQHTSTHEATHRTEKMQHQYPSDTPDTPDTPATGKGLWRVAKSVPLPLPPPYPSPNPGGFENPCPSLLKVSARPSNREAKRRTLSRHLHSHVLKTLRNLPEVSASQIQDFQGHPPTWILVLYKGER